MIAAVLDTNVVVQAVIGSRQAASARVVDGLFEGRFVTAISSTALEELHRVLSLPKFVERHGFSQDEILNYMRAVTANANVFVPVMVGPFRVRDVTDRAILALTKSANADFLVTNDRRHLLPLKRFDRAKIVTPAAFLRHLR